MQNAESAKKIRCAVLESLKGRPAYGEPAREALHKAFMPYLAELGAPGQDDIRLAARSGLEALLLAGAGAVDGSVDVMQVVVGCAGRLNLESAFAIRSALLGLAEVGQKAPQGSTFSMKMALEDAFMGVGDAFDEALRQVKTEALR